MRKSGLRWIGIAAAASMLLPSVAAAAPAPQVNPWQALSVLNGGASTIAFCGAAVAAQAQGPVRSGCVLPQVDAPPVATSVIDQPIPPPLPGGAPGFAVSPLIIALGLIAAGALAYLLLHHKGSNQPNSPA